MPQVGNVTVTIRKANGDAWNFFLDAQRKCKDTKCPADKICILNRRNEPTCECPKYCPYKQAYKKLGKVCASNKKTYKDVCHMHHHSCREQTNLTVLFYGSCYMTSKFDDKNFRRIYRNIVIISPQVLFAAISYDYFFMFSALWRWKKRTWLRSMRDMEEDGILQTSSECNDSVLQKDMQFLWRK